MGFIIDIAVDFLCDSWLEKVRKTRPLLFWTINAVLATFLALLVALMLGWI
jgi:hypothetical protein